MCPPSRPAGAGAWLIYLTNEIVFHAIPVTYAHWFLGEEKDAGVKADLISQLRKSRSQRTSSKELKLALQIQMY